MKRFSVRPCHHLRMGVKGSKVGFFWGGFLIRNNEKPTLIFDETPYEEPQISNISGKYLYPAIVWNRRPKLSYVPIYI